MKLVDAAFVDHVVSRKDNLTSDDGPTSRGDSLQLQLGLQAVLAFMLRRQTHSYILETHLPVLNSVIRAQQNSPQFATLLAKLYEVGIAVFNARIVPDQSGMIVQCFQPGKGYQATKVIDEKTGYFVEFFGEVKGTPYLSSGKLFSLEKRDGVRLHNTVQLWS